MKQTNKLTIIGLVSFCSFMLLSSCGSSEPKVEVVDLDKVLDKFSATAKAMPPVDEKKTKNVDKKSDKDDKTINTFVTKYTKALNDAKIVKSPVAVAYQTDGSFLGFKDINKNGKKDSGDTDLFKVELYPEENKMIATDLVHKEYRRDHRFSGTGFLAGYLVSRMLFRQKSAGVNTSRKFRGKSMSSRGYHSNAVKTKTSAAKSARKSSGSKSFRSGK